MGIFLTIIALNFRFKFKFKKSITLQEWKNIYSIPSEIINPFVIKESLFNYPNEDKKESEFDTSGFKLQNVKDIPRQMNGSDCGMFTLKYAEYLSRNVGITFTQEDMPYFRRRMVYEIVNNKVIHPWENGINVTYYALKT